MLSVVTQSTNAKYDISDYCVVDDRINTLERYETGIYQSSIITLGVYKTHEDALEVYHQMIEHEQEHKIYFMPDKDIMPDRDRVNKKYYVVELVERRFGESFINIKEIEAYYPDFCKTSGKYDRKEIHSFENLKDLSEFMKDNYWITDGDISLSEEDKKKLLELAYE